MQYIVRYVGSGDPDIELLKKVLKENKAEILDSSTLPKMALLGNVDYKKLSKLKADVPEGWEFFNMNAQGYPVPDTRKKVTRRSKK